MMLVEAYVASWIEIVTSNTQPSPRRVEAYVASWIEIETDKPEVLDLRSRLT